MKIFKKKLILVLTSIIVLGLIIFGYTKIREYNILKDAFGFKQENILEVWRVKKGENYQDYDYKLESNEVDALSSILTNSKLKKVSINDGSPSNILGNLTILLDGRIREVDGGTSYQFERSINLTPIDKHSVYVFLEINKLRDDGSSNMHQIMQKAYIIDSERLVGFINEHT